MYSYARKSEFDLPEEDTPLKFYQRRFLLRHLPRFVPPAARVLEIGAGHDREVLDGLSAGEKWVADEYRGLGSGPARPPDWADVRIELCAVGLSSVRLPSAYFDCVYSLSVLEHVDRGRWQDVTDEIYRIMRPGAVTMHCVDAILKSDFDQRLQYRDCFLRSGFRPIDPAAPAFRQETALADPDLFVMSKKMFERLWRPKIPNNPTYEEFGMPTSVNLGFFK